ncbi:carbohydrate ABC transporter membrane protein 1 (CUT1 family) [Scopulibacillus darangshiensis]|uniref:Carbohydrate ABC transporter membrane protein 1 (CUT1 family) n=1 Tax=Scopulibacillus darangshiensis TaxID=442528 RepID=A0A4R2P4G6_9BACL|nr:sugar ABC transporter permease [Scopulibacillus darangshiensis]TCP29642.1 carbohydrate ABC transporter membrane protein 1 (CUT1 family) [Scopulibacillus darangshiensis]
MANYQTSTNSSINPKPLIKKPDRKSKRIIETITPYLFLLPNIIGFLIFTAFPVLFSIIMSFFDWPMLDKPRFIGLENYIHLFTKDELFVKVLLNTVYYVVVLVPLNVIVSLGFAVWLNSISRGSVVFRTMFFMPILVPMVASALIWKWLYNPQYGLINGFLGWFGIDGPNWLGDPKFAMLSIIIMSVWAGFGYNMVIFIAGLQGIPKTLYEAASIDGARKWTCFWKITLPMLSPTMFFAVIMTIISSFQVFDQAFIMTNGGPFNKTNTIVYYIYQNGFEFFKMGYASAIAWVLFAAIFVVTLVQMKMQKKWVHYE